MQGSTISTNGTTSTTGTPAYEGDPYALLKQQLGLSDQEVKAMLARASELDQDGFMLQALTEQGVADPDQATEAQMQLALNQMLQEVGLSERVSLAVFSTPDGLASAAERGAVDPAALPIKPLMFRDNGVPSLTALVGELQRQLLRESLQADQSDLILRSISKARARPDVPGAFQIRLVDLRHEISEYIYVSKGPGKLVTLEQIPWFNEDAHLFDALELDSFNDEPCAIGELVAIFSGNHTLSFTLNVTDDDLEFQEQVDDLIYELEGHGLTECQSAYPGAPLVVINVPPGIDLTSARELVKNHPLVDSYSLY